MADYVIVNGQLYHSDALSHHGIKGMRWGVRRFQTKDGSLTPSGKKRYATTAQGVRNANQAAKDARKKSLAESRATESGIGSYRRAMNKASSAANEAYRNSIAKDKAYNKQLREEKKAAKEESGTERKGLSDKQKKALKLGAIAVGSAMATYGALKVHDYVRERNEHIRVGQKLVKANEQIFFNLNNSVISPSATNAQRQAYIDSKNEMSKTMLNVAQNLGRAHAKSDSFGTAVKNVLEDEMRRRARR